MLYTIDRVQYSKEYNQYYFYEFMELGNINILLKNEKELIPPDELWKALSNMVSEKENNKITFLKSIDSVIRIFIFYQQGLNKFIRIELNSRGIFGDIWSYVELQSWFQWLNNIDGQSNSKGLGSVRATHLDSYVNSLLQSIYEDSQFHDDNGLELTKSLLGSNATKGFDLDLFQFIPSTKEYIIYEFLKRENQHINNIQAHPMRYCWTGKWNDNKQKFISLWKAKEFFNGKLLLISYSDDSSERISIIEVLDIDIDNGILAEKKYSMSRNVFLGWLKDMSEHTTTQKDYFIDFKCKEYDEEFFRNFSENKRNYGKEFL